VLKIGMNLADAERALLLLDDGLRSVGVPYWLSEGTALGVYRAGALIPATTISTSRCGTSTATPYCAPCRT
jgi:hypothetical protein